MARRHFTTPSGTLTYGSAVPTCNLPLLFTGYPADIFILLGRPNVFVCDVMMILLSALDVPPSIFLVPAPTPPLFNARYLQVVVLTSFSPSLSTSRSPRLEFLYLVGV